MPAADGFLRHSFLPVRVNCHPELLNYRKVEREFFTSLSYLCSLYGFAMPDVSKQVFPFNLQCAYEYARTCLKQVAPALQLIVIQDSWEVAYLATVAEYDTDCWLYYVPVNQLVRLTQRKQKKQAQLLLSVFAYLYQVAKMPFYTDSSSYLFYEYEMLENWVQDDPENAEDYVTQLEQIRQAHYFGGKLLRQIRHPYHLQQFENRVNRYAPKTPADTELQEVSRELLQLYKRYPKNHLFLSVHEKLLNPKVEERLRPNQYISFCWNDYGILNNTLIEMVNNEFQEYSVIDLPMAIQIFDAPQEKPCHDLDFEKQIFGLITQLMEVLNDMQ